MHEIHNPVVRLVHEHELFAALGFPRAKVLTQMNPDVSLTLADEAEAERAADVLRGLYVHPGTPLFEVDRRGPQVFLELLMPRRQHGETLPPIRHTTLTGFEAPFDRHVHEHPTNDQSTAQHDEPGFLLAYSAGRKLEMVRPRDSRDRHRADDPVVVRHRPAALDDRAWRARDPRPLSHADTRPCVTAARPMPRRSPCRGVIACRRSPSP